MSMLHSRLQVLIDDELWRRLGDEAERRRVPVSRLVRQAIDERYPGRSEERRAALAAVLRTRPMPVPNPAQLRRQLDEVRARSTK